MCVVQPRPKRLKTHTPRIRVPTGGIAMDGEGLRLITVGVNGREGVFKGYVDGSPARVPSFVSSTTPALGLAQV